MTLHDAIRERERVLCEAKKEPGHPVNDAYWCGFVDAIAPLVALLAPEPASETEGTGP